MQDISRQRCFNHESREAVARCPECSRYFCRECVTEHDDRVMCSGCLKKQVSDFKEKKKRFRIFSRLVLFSGNLLFLWFLFYYSGRLLLKIPASFHEGTLWQNLW